MMRMIALLTLITSEFLKLKRTNLYFGLIATSVFISIISAILALQDEFSIASMLSQSVILINYIIGISVFSIFTGLVISKEYEQETIPYLFTSPYKRIEFLFAKMILILCLISFTVILTFILSLVIGVIFTNELFNLNEILPYVKVYVLTIFMQFSLLPLVILLTMVWKNYIVSIALGLVTAFSIGIISATPIGAFYPWSAPLFITYDLLDIIDTYMIKHITGLVALFVITLLASLFYTTQCEIK